MRHPQFENVFSGCSLCCSSDMAVHINQSREDIHTLTIQFFSASFQFWTGSFIDGQSGIPYRFDGDDPVLLNHNIHRTNGWRTGAVDKGCSP